MHFIRRTGSNTTKWPAVHVINIVCALNEMCKQSNRTLLTELNPCTNTTFYRIQLTRNSGSIFFLLSSSRLSRVHSMHLTCSRLQLILTSETFVPSKRPPIVFAAVNTIHCYGCLPYVATYHQPPPSAHPFDLDTNEFAVKKSS